MRKSSNKKPGWYLVPGEGRKWWDGEQWQASPNTDDAIPLVVVFGKSIPKKKFVVLSIASVSAAFALIFAVVGISISIENARIIAERDARLAQEASAKAEAEAEAEQQIAAAAAERAEKFQQLISEYDCWEVVDGIATCGPYTAGSWGNGDRYLSERVVTRDGCSQLVFHNARGQVITLDDFPALHLSEITLVSSDGDYFYNADDNSGKRIDCIPY